MRLAMAFALILVFLIGGAGRAQRGPLSPEAAQQQFRIDPGLRIELVACEPQIESPVAMAFDEQGRLWVVEMRDYPNGPAPGQPPQGRIKVLEDRDGDGRYEQSRVFADQLLFANGLLPWRDGVLVTAAPHILLLRDTDGDGVADKREVLYEGFATQNPQLRVSHPILGMDNWIYVANGLRGGQIKRAGESADKPVNLSGLDFRFNLLDGRHEAISGPGQYGNTFDDWGNRFVCDNRHHLRHVVLPQAALKRNPFLTVPATLNDPSNLDDGPLSSGGKIYPLSRNWTTSNLHAGRFTAACGVFVYRDGLLGQPHRGSAFTCDPTGNLVHEEVLEEHGASFRSRPARTGVEFLATPDDWCRPVSLSHGPDGALYVVDMYRAVIEHPEFMPPELKQRPDLLVGRECGRIWRIVPEKDTTRTARPMLDKASSENLVQLLGHEGSWWRTTAQRLLLQRGDQESIPLLKKACATGSPLARAQAAWLLDSMAALDEAILLALLASPDAQVARQAVILAEPRLPTSRPLQLAVAALAASPSSMLRFQVALSLGVVNDDQILEPLTRIAQAAPQDPWTRAAVLAAVPTRGAPLLQSLFKKGMFQVLDANGIEYLSQLTGMIGARQEPAEIGATLQALTEFKGADRLRWQMVGLGGLADGLSRRGTQLTSILTKLPPQQQDARAAVAAILAAAGRNAAQREADADTRLTAVRLLAHAPWEQASAILRGLLTDEPRQEIRLAAIRALATQSNPAVSGILLDAWRSYTPATRREALEALLRNPGRIRGLLDAVEAGRVKPGDLDPVRVRQLVNHNTAEIRDRARTLLQQSLPAERRRVLQDYKAAFALKGDPLKGRGVFQKNCATCHRVAGIGIEVGPDISDTRTKTAEQLLTDILDPNAAIDNNFVNYVVTTKSGRIVTGILATETASSLTLKRAENQTDAVLRQDVEELQSTGVSLMPEGLEKTIPVAEMADLLAFLKNWRYLDGDVPR